MLFAFKAGPYIGFLCNAIGFRRSNIRVQRAQFTPPLTHVGLGGESIFLVVDVGFNAILKPPPLLLLRHLRHFGNA